MKRPIILLGLAVLFGLVIAGAFLGCSGGGKLDGRYVSENNQEVLEFESDSKVELISTGLFGDEYRQELEYKIEEDKLSIKYPQGFSMTLTITDSNTIQGGGNVFIKKSKR